jgi:hypothetical protein
MTENTEFPNIVSDESEFIDPPKKRKTARNQRAATAKRVAEWRERQKKLLEIGKAAVGGSHPDTLAEYKRLAVC